MYEYDKNGNLRGYSYVHGIKVLGEDAYAEIREICDHEGNQLREAYYDQEGQPEF